MLIFVGAGLSSVDDLTISGLKALRSSEHVYLDMYTSIIPGFAKELEQLIATDVQLADRELIEEGHELLELARDHTVSFVVIGDPLSATTHADLILRAVKLNIPFRIIHNTSIMTAVGCCGLQLYNFGATISIPFWDESGAPDSFYDKLLGNFASGLHTLCLLDIRVKEKSLENILRQRNVYEPSRFMSCEIAAQQLLEIADKRQASSGDICPALAPDCLAVGLARVGSATQMIVVTSLKEMSRTCDDERKTCDSASVAMTLGGPLHSMIIPGFIQPIEEEFLLSRYLHSESSSQNLPIVAIPSHSNLSNELTDLRQLFAVHNRLVLGAKNGIKHSTKSYMHTLRSFFIAYLHELRPSLFFQALYVPAIVVVHFCFYVCPLLRLETSGDRPRLRMNYGSLISPLMLSIVGPEV